MFHVALHGRKFTIIPFIGESGNVQTNWINGNGRDVKGRMKISRGSIDWKISSQLKYGRDGNDYALHQLHRQPSYALIATLSTGETFCKPEPLGSENYVKPFVLVRKDFRVVINATEVYGSASASDFVRDIEEALIKREKGKNNVPFVLEEARRRARKGLLLKRGLVWLTEAAAEMNKFWQLEPNRRYVKKSDGRVIPGVYPPFRKGSGQSRCPIAFEKESLRNPVDIRVPV